MINFTYSLNYMEEARHYMLHIPFGNIYYLSALLWTLGLYLLFSLDDKIANGIPVFRHF